MRAIRKELHAIKEFPSTDGNVLKKADRELDNLEKTLAILEKAKDDQCKKGIFTRLFDYLGEHFEFVLGVWVAEIITYIIFDIIRIILIFTNY